MNSGAAVEASRREAFDVVVERASTGGVAKRAFDVAAAAALLLLFTPLFLCIAIAIKLDSSGPILYRCRRVGWRGGEFTMLKFRKMRTGVGGASLTVAGDERLTRLGRLLVSTKLDELPQLWNVVRGEMSLVGPRPEDAAVVSLHEQEYGAILAVRPGITGLTQLAFAREGAILDRNDLLHDYLGRLLPQKMLIDTIYAERRSFSMDLRIIGWTVVAVGLRRDIAVDRATARLSVRRPRTPFDTAGKPDTPTTRTFDRRPCS
jgi:lipopolysaccharide/colanic/teichoic acid biosynthesis glycosyltransferase